MPFEYHGLPLMPSEYHGLPFMAVHRGGRYAEDMRLGYSMLILSVLQSQAEARNRLSQTLTTVSAWIDSVPVRDGVRSQPTTINLFDGGGIGGAVRGGTHGLSIVLPADGGDGQPSRSGSPKHGRPPRPGSAMPLNSALKRPGSAHGSAKSGGNSPKTSFATIPKETRPSTPGADSLPMVRGPNLNAAKRPVTAPSSRKG